MTFMNSVTTDRMGRPTRPWLPNAEQQSLFNAAKDDLICFMNSYKEGLDTYLLYGKIANDSDSPVNFRKMGFNSFGEFLFQCKDVLKLRTDGYKFYLFSGCVPSDIGHVRQFVEHQFDTKYKRFMADMNNTFQISIETLLDIHYDLRIPIPTAQLLASADSAMNKNTNDEDTSRYDGLGRSGTKCIAPAPALRPLNQAAVELLANLRPVKPVEVKKFEGDP